MLEKERTHNLAKDLKSNGKDNVWSENDNRKNTNKLMDRLELDETMNKIAKANGVRWYGHVLRRENDDVSQKALEFKLDGKKRERPKMT